MTKLFGPDLYEQYFYSLELNQFMTVIANYGKMVQQIEFLIHCLEINKFNYN